MSDFPLSIFDLKEGREYRSSIASPEARYRRNGLNLEVWDRNSWDWTPTACLRDESFKETEVDE